MDLRNRSFASTTVIGPISQRLTYRALLYTTALSSLLAYGVGQAHGNDLCKQQGTIQTCEGDQSDGVRANSDVTQLIVQNLSGDIRPTGSVPGVSIYDYQRSVTVETDLGPFAIRSSGAGIDAGSYNGSVTVDHEGDIFTSGDRFAPGIRASSAGYNFNRITIEAHSGTIETSGENSAGIQSSGGHNVLTNIASGSTIRTSGDGSAGITAFGGNSTFIVITGDIETRGENAVAARASSNYEAASVSNSATIRTEGPGSSGLVASGYNSASIRSSGDVTTLGHNSSALIASSYRYDASVTSSGVVNTAGDFSRGASAFSQYGLAEIFVDGDITTTGDAATAIFAQSLYDGAKVRIASDVSTQGIEAHGVSISSGRYGVSQVNLLGSIRTSGQNASAILARPSYSDLSIQVADAASMIATSGDGATAIRIQAEGSYYSSLNIDVVGSITTEGDDAPGVDLSSQNHSTRINVSGDLSTGGDRSPGIRSETYNGLAEITVSGRLQTLGDLSSVIDLRGQYYSRMDVEISSDAVISSSGNDASALRLDTQSGGMNLQHAGQIITSGSSSHGISIENSGTDQYSAVMLLVSGDVDVSGTDSHGVDLSVEDTTTFSLSGNVQGGIGTGAGLFSTGGGDVILDVSGSISARSGLAITAGSGNDFVTNTGLIQGDIDLGLGQNRFINASGGSLNTGSIIDLSSEGQFENSGVMTLNQANIIGLTELTGDFVQTSSGQLLFDLDLATNTADQLRINGTADIGGNLLFNVISADVDPSMVFDSVGIEIISASEGLTLNGPEFSPEGFEIPDTVAFDFSFTAIDTRLLLMVDAIRLDFVPLLDASSTDNQFAVADYLDRVRISGSSEEIGSLVSSLRMSADAVTLQQRLGLLIPASLPAQLRQTELRAEAALQVNSRCQTENRRVCIWMNVLAGTGKDVIESENFDEDSREILFGGDMPLGSSTSLSAGVAIGEFDSTLGLWRQADGDRLQVWTRLDHDLSSAIRWTTQGVWTQDEATTKRSSAIDQSQSSVLGNAETAAWAISTDLHRELNWGDWTYSPSIGAGYSCITEASYSELGFSGEEVISQYDGDCNISGRTRFRIESPVWENSRWRTQLGLQAGLTARASDQIVINSRLGGAPESVQPFESRFDASNDVIASTAIEFQLSDLQERWVTQIRLAYGDAGAAKRNSIDLTFTRSF